MLENGPALKGRERKFAPLRAFAITPDPRCTAADCGVCIDLANVPERQEFSVLRYLPGRLDNPCAGWECKKLWFISGEANFAELWEGSDGWVVCSPPWRACNPDPPAGCGAGVGDPPQAPNERQSGPCFTRRNWWTTEKAKRRSFDPMAYKIWCGWGKAAVDCSNEPESLYLLNVASTRKAQTLVASSYGLLQIMFGTAIDDMEWRSWDPSPCAKNPQDLFNPWENLNLGVGYLTELLRKKAMAGKEEQLFATRAELEQALKLALGHYNGGEQRNVKEYAAAVWRNVAKYKPFLQ
jgi:hypothetical protein